MTRILLRLTQATVLAISVACCGAIARAQTFTWNSGTTSTPTDGAGTWSTSGTRWWNGSANVVWPAGPTSTIAGFGNGGTAGTVTVSGSLDVGGITFGPTATTSRYTLSGGTVGLADSATIFLSGSYTPPANNATGIAGASIINSRLVANNLTVSQRAGETNITALTLGGSNSLTGTLTVTSSAAVKVNAVNALDGGADVTVNAGGAVEISATGTFSNNFALSDNGFGALRFNRPTTMTGAITMETDVVIGTSNNLDGVTGPVFIDGAIGETAGGPKSLTLRGNLLAVGRAYVVRGIATYTGSTTIAASTRVQLEGGDNRLPSGTALTLQGRLILGGTNFGAMSQEVSWLSTTTNEALVVGGATGTSTLVVNNADSVAWSKTLGGAGTNENNFGITKKGAGTLTLSFESGRPATYSGPTTVLEGTLTAGKVSNNSPIIVHPGATYNFAHSSGTFGGPITTTISGTGAVTVTSGTLTLASNSTFAGTFSNSSTTFLTGSNTFTGTTVLAAGNLEVGNQFALGGGGDIRFSGGTLRFSGSGTPDVAAQVKNSASAMSFNTNEQDVTFENSLGSSNTGGLTKSGSGTLTLAANNSYGGTTTVSAGVLRTGGSGTAFGTGTVSLGTTAGATLDINGFNQSIAALAGGGTAGGSININSGTLAVGSANTSTTYTGNFTGTPGTLAKQGLGILTLNGTTSTLAGVSLQSGQLLVAPSVSSTFALGTITRSVGSGVGLTFGTGTAVTVDAAQPLPNGILGPWAWTGSGVNSRYATHTSGTIAAYTAGTAVANLSGLPNDATANVDLAGYTGTAPAVVSANTIRFTAGGTLNTGSTSFTVNGLMLAAGSAVTIQGNPLSIGSSGELVVVGPGSQGVIINSRILETVPGSGVTFNGQSNATNTSLTLGGSSGFTGDINFTNGQLLIINGGGTFANVNMNANLVSGAQLRAGPSGLQRIGSITGLGVAFVKQNTGTTSLLDTSFYTGTTSIQSGVLEVNSLANIGTAGSLGNPASANAAISIGTSSTTATLRYVGSGTSTTDRPINMAGTTGGAALDAAGSGAVVFTGNVTAAGAGLKTFMLTGTSTAENTFAGAIADNSSTNTTSVTKAGVGRWVLSGSSSYTGAFNLDNGTLVAGANAPQSGDGVFGSSAQAALPTIGSTGGITTGTASLLARAGFSINRDLSIAAASGSQVVVLGGADLSGTATFGADSTPANFRVGRPVTLAAAGSGTSVGTVRFLNTWSNLDGTDSPTESFTIGSVGNEGIVSLGSSLTTSGSIVAAYGTFNLELDTEIQPGTGLLSIGSAASLGGVGTVLGTLAGSGRIGPGNSPGILTATSVDPGQLIFDFEFTAAGAPDYSSVTASVNDVLRLTGTSPFASSLISSNIVNVYFDMASVGDGDTFLGGFFTDQQADFFASVSGATFSYFIRDSLGGTLYNGVQYSPFASSVTVSTVASGPSFDGGSVEGRITQFSVIVVPEPGALALLAAGAALVGSRALGRRRN